MTFMDGVKITKRDALEKLELDPYAVATKLIKVFYKQLFIDRFFHADPHPGNFFVQSGPEGSRGSSCSTSAARPSCARTSPTACSTSCRA